ncbi:hypothetical protein ESB00_00625 [Oleiharenicola lentus]|jgi:hypothetical protein|uniref:Uncharacterized protein n=1 Tax=Oleiharenicola lentus TaxID=2508720 RepID=A0A4Q1C6M4_9BACT|nr:hypothetical protein [Oleiharenicola lentus]RXK54436.1 hypothetical protein ESB00_00625 [Oleiharenicola lentus]
MAWRIDEAVVRGEIDNRTRGRVTGRLWFVGRDEPVVLELEGNCWRDLAGRRLEFTNPQPKPGALDKLAPLQRGTVGDISASRKVKVPDVPLSDLHLYYKTGREMPWHWGNALYLEWISERNGRVVIETATFDLKIVGEPAWEMSEAEEEVQRKANGAALTGFMDRLAAAAGAAEREIVDDTPAEWDERPQTEEEAEAEQARSDKLADRIEARLRKEGEEAYDRILEEEIDRLHREEGRPEPTPEQLARNAEWIEEMNRAGEEALTNPDPELEQELEFEHPLVERVTEFALQLREAAQAEGWRPEDAGQEHPVTELLDATLIAGPKLAGALNGKYWPPEIEFCAHTIVRLKRARGYLEDALRAVESCHEEKLIKPEHLGPILVKLGEFIQDTDALIAELRAKLERGTD